jgi:phospholipid/cholesterol/gamma-HCH transport system substrate-binding protein
VASKELNGLISENKQNLAALIANFITVGNVTTARLDGIEQLLVTYPDVVTGGYTVVPGDGTAHFGLVLNADDPAACEVGYEGTKKVDPHRSEALPPVNTKAHCAAPRDSGINVRGAQNRPKPIRGGGGGSSYPIAYAATPVALGSGVTSRGSASFSVQTPVAPAGATGPTWLWMMQEAAR